MRTGLIIFGVIFLVVGAALYFVPMQEFSADTTTSEDGDIENRTSSASVTIPRVYSYASAIIGFILLILGLSIPGSAVKSNSRKDPYDKVVESKENIEVGDGNKRKIVRERTEKHKRKDEDN